MGSLLICRNYLRFSARHNSTVTIPNKKVRSPTALLQALANTVQWDPTSGAPYQYIDDPHTVPKTRNEKKEFVLSRASGRSSARWFMQHYPWLFESVESVPKVAAFTAPRHADSPMEGADPPLLGKKKNYEQRRVERRQLSPSWQNVSLLISERRAEDAWAMWQTMTSEKSKQKVGDDQRQVAVDLFSLLSFSNLASKSASNQMAKPLEHRFYGNSFEENATGGATTNVVGKWQTEGPAEQLYAFLESKNWVTPIETCTLIRGMLRFGERDKAKEIYESKVKAAADVATFVDLIAAAGQTGPAQAEPRLQAVTELLKDYKKAGHAPDVAVFRSVLIATAFCARNRFGQEFALKVLAEMARVQVNPASSPALVAALLEIFYPSQNSSPNGFLPVLLSFLESSFNGAAASAEVSHPKDRELASNLMLKACDIFRDADMACRIHNLLSNQRPGLLLFTDVNRETAYYSALLSTLALGDTVDRLMETYQSVVPSRWLPSPNVFAQIVDAVELQRHFELLPTLWQEAVRMRLPYGFQMLTEKFAYALERALINSSNANVELFDSLAAVASNMIDHAEYAEVARLTRGVSLSPVALASLFKLSMSDKVPPNSALNLAFKVGALCQRLHLTSATILQQQRQRSRDIQPTTDQKQQNADKPKKPHEVLAYFGKLAASTDKSLPPQFENWLRGSSTDAAPEKSHEQAAENRESNQRGGRFGGSHRRNFERK